MIATMLSPLAAWLLTYLVHSTLLLGGVAILTRWVVRREALRETLWKAALVGGVVTATVALALPRPGGMRIDVAALGGGSVEHRSSSIGHRASIIEDAGATDRSPADFARPATEGDPAGSSGTGEAPGGSGGGTDADIDRDADADREVEDRVEVAVGAAGSGGAPGAGGSGGSPEVAAAGPAWWLVALVGLWSAVAGFLLFRLGYRHARLRWLLRDRRQVPGADPAAVALTELRRTAGVWRPVRLTTTSAVATPLALGSVEVCVPERFLTELGPDEQRVALAHELAHLARRDPVWQVAGAVLGALLFFQPLNGVARRAIRSTAEYLADAWAVSQTGSRVQLAKCLAAVAGWVAPAREPALAGTVAMAEGGSPLLARVQRLLEREPEPPTAATLRVVLAVGIVAMAAGFAPAVSGGGVVSGGELRDGLRTALRDGPREVAREELRGLRDALPSEAGDAELQDSLDVRRFDRPGLEGDGFVARLNEASRDARQAPYTVAYAISSPRGVRRVAVDSRPWRAGDLDGRPLAEVLGVKDALREADPGPLLVFVELKPEGASTRVERVALRRPDLGMPIAGTVYWLGAAGLDESFVWIRDMYQAVRDADLREALVEAAAVHDIPEAHTFLRRVLDEDGDPDTRVEAMEGMSLRPDTALARLFFDLAMNDPARGIRHEATEQLGRIQVPGAVALLERLAWESNDERVQRQAAESLGEVGTEEAAAALRRLLRDHSSEEVQREALDQVSELGKAAGGLDGEALLQLALTADEADLRREAVERIGELPPERAVPLLRRAVFESGDETVERQAAESLGDVGTEAAFAVLIEVLDANPSEAASFQAVESLAENFPRELVIPVLRDVLYAHPSEKVRRETLDVLGDLGG